MKDSSALSAARRTASERFARELERRFPPEVRNPPRQRTVRVCKPDVSEGAAVACDGTMSGQCVCFITLLATVNRLTL